jgi:antirestriction protein ArdC
LDRKDADIQDNDELTSTKGKIPMLRYYSVFNIDQTEGIPLPPSKETVNELWVCLGLGEKKRYKG